MTTKERSSSSSYWDSLVFVPSPRRRKAEDTEKSGRDRETLWNVIAQTEASLITGFFKLYDWLFKHTLKDYYKLKTLFFLVPRNIMISNKLFEIKLKGP